MGNMKLVNILRMWVKKGKITIKLLIYYLMQFWSLIECIDVLVTSKLLLRLIRTETLGPKKKGYL